MRLWVWWLVASTALAQNARIVLRWKDVPNASGYELQIAKDAAFSEVVLQTRTTVAGYRWEQLPTTTHWWRVRSFDAEGRPSEWSQPKTVAVDSAIPAPLRPADGAIVPCGKPVAFELESSPLVKEYLLELSGSSDFSSVRTLRGAAPSFEVPGLAPGRLWWRTRAVDFKERTTPPGPVRSFTVRAGVPKAKSIPDQTLGTTSVTLTWTSPECAASSVVEVMQEGKDKVSLPVKGDSFTFKVSGAGEYRWRVAGVDERGNAGELSQESVFMVRLATPRGLSETVGASVVLSWQSVPTANSYEVEVQDLGGVSAKTVASQITNKLSASFPELVPGEYRWRVTARDGQGHSSLPSDLRYFVRSIGAPLAIPTLAQPLDDSVQQVGTTALATWSGVEGATHYELELDGTPTRAAGTSFETPALEEGTHSFRVRALGAGFRVSEWSPVVRVFVGRPSVEQAVVVRSKDTLTITFIDAKGRVIEHTEPTFTVQRGGLSEPSRLEASWQIEWTPPAVGDDFLFVQERGFRHVELITAEDDKVGSLALRVGGVFNGGSVHSANVGLGLGVRFPFLRRQLGLEVRGGWYGAQTEFSVADLDLVGTASIVPLSVLLAFHQNLANFQVKLGVGPAFQLAWFDVASEQFFDWQPGVEAVVAGAYRLGPGRLELELGFLYSRFDTALIRLTAGGFTVRAGYVFQF